MSEKSNIVTISKWPEINQDDLDDSIHWAGREPFPADKHANVFRTSDNVGLLGVPLEDLERSERQYSGLGHGVLYLGRRLKYRLGALPTGISFGTHETQPDYRFVAVTLAPYVLLSTMVLTDGKRIAKEPGGEVGDSVVQSFGVFGMDEFTQAYPNVPVVRRPAQG